MFQHIPKPHSFIGSYPPVTPAGMKGEFFVNTHLLQDDRRQEVVGAVKCRSSTPLR